MDLVTVNLHLSQYENSQLEAQCLALKTSKKTASRIQEELKDRCVRIETEVNFVRTRINAAEERRKAAEEIARESQQVATTARKRIAELEYALAQRIARVKELELSLDEVNKLFDKSMESLSYKVRWIEVLFFPRYPFLHSALYAVTISL